MTDLIDYYWNMVYPAFCFTMYVLSFISLHKTIERPILFLVNFKIWQPYEQSVLLLSLRT